MTAVLKNALLISAMLVLGILVWLDNTRNEGSTSAASTTRQTIEGENAGGGVASNDAAAVAQIKNPLATFDESELSDTIKRPLFASSRSRPLEAESISNATAAQAATKAEVPSYDLLGIIRDGSRAIALIRDKKDGTSFRVEVGDMIGGWRVSKLAPTSILLERDDGTSQSVTLF